MPNGIILVSVKCMHNSKIRVLCGMFGHLFDRSFVRSLVLLFNRVASRLFIIWVVPSFGEVKDAPHHRIMRPLFADRCRRVLRRGLHTARQRRDVFVLRSAAGVRDVGQHRLPARLLGENQGFRRHQLHECAREGIRSFATQPYCFSRHQEET